MKTNGSFLLLCLFVVVSSLALKATHNRSGEILYYKMPGAYTYSIVVVKYTNDGPNIADRCVDTVHFGDGTTGIATRQPGNLTGCGCPTPNGCGDLIFNLNGYVVKKNVYVVVHTYPGPGSFLIRSLDPNRTQGIVNIPNSVNIPFYIESLLIIDASDSQNSSPQLARAPIDQGVTGACFYHNPCAFDPDGDSLSFEITTCRGANGQTIPGYFYPATGTGGTYGIDAETGLLTWCTPQTQGLHSIAFIISEWRRPDCNSPYVLKGYVMRDMEILVATGNTSVITTSSFQDTCVVAGDQLVKTFTAALGGQPYSFNFQVLGSATSPFSGAPPAVISPTSATSGVATLNWSTTCAQARKMPHYIHLVITANTSPVRRTMYETFKVKVTPPQPKITSVVTSTNSIAITWNNLTACSNLKSYNVYRTFNHTTWTPGPCTSGVPGNSGYSFLASVPGSTGTTTQFVDNDLWWLPVTATGNYIITALTTDCAESMPDTIITQKLLVGLEEEKTTEEDWQIFPNPSSSKFVVSRSPRLNDPVQVVLFSSDGKKILQKVFSAGTAIEIDSSSLPNGIYLLELSTGATTRHRKFVKN